MNALTDAQKDIVRRLRPPGARPMRLVFGFGHKPPNFGYTLAFQAGEPVIAPGAGTVEQVVPVAAQWRHTSPSIHDSSTTYAVVINHGLDIRTVVHGLASVDGLGARQVVRGIRLGLPAAQEVWFGIQVGGTYFDPQQINRHFVVQDGYWVSGQGGFLRQAPNIMAQAVGSVISAVASAVRYFWPVPNRALLFNLDFNGNGSKIGLAAVGVTATDYWNATAPSDYGPTYVYTCVSASTTYPMTPVFFMRDYTGTATAVAYERVTLSSFGGTSAWFDPMLSTWIGGYTGSGPRENSFNLRNLPVGNYLFYFYANDGTPPDTSTFYVAVNSGSPAGKTNTPTVVAAWVEDGNYVVLPVAIAALTDVVHVQMFGYASGCQIYRAA